jgi:hypothetical protein
MHGSPVQVRTPAAANDAPLARALWEAFERLSGVRFEIG